MQLVLAPSTVVGVDNNKNVINALIQSRTRLAQTCAFGRIMQVTSASYNADIGFSL